MSPASLQSGAAMDKLDDTLGVLFVGANIVMVLWGITCHQTFKFFKHSTKDNSTLNLIIVVLWLLDTLDGILIAHLLYHFMVTNYLIPMALVHRSWTFKILAPVISIINFITRSLYTWRFHALRPNLPFLALITFFSVLEFVFSLVIFGKGFGIATSVSFKISWTYFYLCFSACAAANVSLFVGLSWLFFYSEAGFRSTNSLVAALSAYIVNTGFLAIFDIALTIIAYITMPKKLVFLSAYFLMNKLFFSAYLATLNQHNSCCRESESQNMCLSNFVAATGAGTTLQQEASIDAENVVLF